MSLGTRSVESISTARSLRSNGSQHFPPEKPLINANHVTSPRSRHTSRNGIAVRSRETDRHPSSKTHRTYLTHLPLSLGGKCTSMGEAETLEDLAESPRGRDLRRLGRKAERPRPYKTWPRPYKTRPIPVEFGRWPTHTMGTWPTADPYYS